LAGANLRGTTTNGQPNDLMKILTDSGIQVVRGINSLANTTSRRVILLNTDSIHSNDVGYTIDSIPNVLTLPDMTAACLNHLKKFTPKKFFMMVEGGNIDHAGHANDGATVIKETLNFNQALQLAYDFYLEHPKETLIVVTADHDTGGLSVGNKYTGYNAYLQYIDYQRVSKEAFSDWCHALLRSRRNFTWDDMKEYLTDNFGFWEQVPVDDTQTATLQSLFDKTFNMRNSADQVSLYNSFNEFAVEVFNVMNTVAGIGWTSPHHTGNEVPVFAIGVGADKFASFNNNIDIPAKIRAIAKLK
jgi:alkaline phosphatase